MNPFEYPITVRGGSGAGLATNVLVGTGTVFTVLPTSIMAQLGLTVARHVPVEFPDGTITDVPECYAEIVVDGESTSESCLFTDKVSPKLGTLTMDKLFLMVDRTSRRLVPARYVDMGHPGPDETWISHPTLVEEAS